MKFEMISRKAFFILALSLLAIINGKDDKVTIDFIDPDSGPLSGGTRVIVRGGPYRGREKEFPKPKVKINIYTCYSANLDLLKKWLMERI